MSTETHDEDVVAYVVLHQATSSPKKVAEEFNLTVERAMELWDQATCTRYLRRHKTTSSIASADVGSVSVPAVASRGRKSEASSRTRAATALPAPPSPSIASSVASVAPSTASKVEAHAGAALRSTRKRGAVEKPVDTETRDIVAAVEPVVEVADEHALSSATAASTRSVKKSKKSLASASQSEVTSSQHSEAPMSQQDTQPLPASAPVEAAAEPAIALVVESTVSAVKPRTARPSRLSRASEDRGSKVVGHAAAGTPVLSNLVHNMSPPMLAQTSPLPSPTVTSSALPPASLPPAAADVPVLGVPAAAQPARHHHASVTKHKPKHDTTSAGARAMKNQLHSVLSDISARAGSEFAVFGMQSMRTADAESRPLVAQPKHKKSSHKRVPTLLDAAREAVKSADHYKQNLAIFTSSKPSAAAASLLQKIAARK